jgi:hypothetical protein
MKRTVTRSNSDAPRQWPSKRCSRIWSPGVQDTKRIGPVPMAARPALKSDVLAPSATRRETM